jgi:hypothetical protein
MNPKLLQYNYKKMERIFRAKPESFKENGFLEIIHPNGLRSYFKENSSNILAVAHLDSVEKPDHFKVLHLSHRSLVFSPVLDDRLGAYLITDLLPKLGVEHDILLTEGEETGQSTAQFFEPAKQYNWMYSFDRAGDDAVLYQYEDSLDFTLEIEKFFNIAIGTFSDISYLEHLGCAGVNVGTCYENYHSKDAWADLTKLTAQVDKFLCFYEKFKGEHFPYEALERDNRLLNNNGMESWGLEEWDLYYRCHQCHNLVTPNSFKGETIERIYMMEWEQVCPDCAFVYGLRS